MTDDGVRKSLRYHDIQFRLTSRVGKYSILPLVVDLWKQAISGWNMLSIVEFKCYQYTFQERCRQIVDVV